MVTALQSEFRGNHPVELKYIHKGINIPELLLAQYALQLPNYVIWMENLHTLLLQLLWLIALFLSEIHHFSFPP